MTEGMYTYSQQNSDVNNSRLRNLQSSSISSAIFTPLLTVTSEKNFSLNKIIVDSASQKIFSVLPKQTNPSILTIVAAPPKAKSSTELVVFNVHQNPCNVIVNGTSDTYVPTNLVQTSSNFVVFTNHNTANNFILQCGADSIDMHCITYDKINNVFTLETSKVNVMEISKSEILSKLGYTGDDYFFQVRATGYIDKTGKIAALILVIKHDADITRTDTDVSYLLGIIDPTKTLSEDNPLEKYLIITDDFSPGMFMVSNIYVIPSTDYVYFVVQETVSKIAKSFFVCVDTEGTPNYSVLSATLKQEIGTGIFQGIYNFDIYYESTSAQFIHTYASDIKGSIMTFNVNFFQLTASQEIDTTSQWEGTFSYTHPCAQQKVNAVTMIGFISPFLLICDYYNCISFKYPAATSFSTVGFSQTFPEWNLISTGDAIINSLAIYSSSNDNDDIYLWGTGVGDNHNFLGSSYLIPTSCPFYVRYDLLQCSAACKTADNYAPLDTLKMCVTSLSNPCNTVNSPFIIDLATSMCSSSCNGLWQVNIINSMYFCVKNASCPHAPNTPGLLTLNYKTGLYPYVTAYNQCVEGCPSDLFTDLTSRSCAKTCSSGLFEGTNINGFYAAVCVSSCSSKYADADARNAPPYPCLSTSSCGTKFMVKPNTAFPLLKNEYGCVETCPTGTYLDWETKKLCLQCTIAEGKLHNNYCYKTCPNYLVTSYSSSIKKNICVNCKDYKYYWYESKCYPRSNITLPVELVDAQFNALKKCSDLKKLYYNSTCINPPCPGGSYPYNSNKSFCYRLFVDKKYLDPRTNTTLDTCPEGYKNNNETRVCQSCKSLDMYEYKRGCVKECPFDYWSSSINACLKCKVAGTQINQSYREKCMLPACPSHAYLDVSKRVCVYCIESNKYLFQGACVTSCPHNSKINFQNNECTNCRVTGSKDYYYANKCLSVCPEGTAPSDYYTCIEQNPSCDVFNPCKNNSTCSVKNNKYICTCASSSFIGQFCHVTANYTALFYSNFLSEISKLKSNYSSFSNANPTVIPLNPIDFTGKLDFLENNYPNFNSVALDLIDQVINLIDKYIIVLQWDKRISFSSNLFLVEDMLLNITEKASQGNRSTRASLRLLEDYQDRVSSIKTQINALAKRIVEHYSYIKKLHEEKLTYSHFNFAMLLLTGNNLENYITYCTSNNYPVIEFPDCEKYIKKKYSNETLFPSFKIDWKSDLTNLGIGNNFSIIHYGNSIDFALLNRTAYSYIYPAYECSKANIPFYVRFSLNLSSFVDLTMYDYFSERDVNIYDKRSKFFNDRCEVFASDDSFDITLLYRRKTLDTNTTIQCSPGCSFVGFDLFNYTICKCSEISSESMSTLSVQIIANSFDDTNGNSLTVVSCAEEVFNSLILDRAFQRNYGLWTGAGIFLILIFILLFTWVLNKIVFGIIPQQKYLMMKVCYFDANFLPAMMFSYQQGEQLKGNKVNNSEYGNNEDELRSEQDNNHMLRENPVVTGGLNLNMDLERESNDIFQLFAKPEDPQPKINKSVEITIQDANELPVLESLTNDRRSCAQYYYHCLIKYNVMFFPFLYSSLIYPFWIRVLILVTTLSLLFGLNAMLFTDEYIDTMYIMHVNYSFAHVWRYQFAKCFASLVIAYIPIFFLRIYLIQPHASVRKRFNEFLISRDYGYIMKGFEHYKWQMRIKHSLTIIFCSVLIIWMWFYQCVFCGIYINTQLMWVYGGIVSCIVDFVAIQGIVIPGMLTLIRLMAQRYMKSEFWTGLYGIFRL